MYSERSATVMAAVCFLICSLYFLRLNAYGAAYYSLLLALANILEKPCPTAFVVFLALTGVFMNAYALFLMYSSSSISVSDSDDIAKPIFILFAVFTIPQFVCKTSSKNDGSRTPNSRPLKKICSRWAPVVLLLLFVLAGLNCVITVFNNDNRFYTINTTSNKGNTTGEQVLSVETEGTEIYFRCQGIGEPTVIFFHGWSGNSLDFYWVQKEVAKSTRTCSFDNPGSGSSNKIGKFPRTSEQIALEIEQALKAMGIEDNLLFVGHSFGAFHMRKFNDMFPNRIKGMVMIDSANPNTTVGCDEPTREREISPVIYLGLFAAETGIFRLVELLGLTYLLGPIGNLPISVQNDYVQHFSRPHFFLSIIEEKKRWFKSCSSFPRFPSRKGQFILDFPLTVIIPSKGLFKNNLSGGSEQADLSAEGKYVLVDDPDATHTNIIFKPRFAKIVSKEVVNMLQKVFSGNTGLTNEKFHESNIVDNGKDSKPLKLEERDACDKPV